MPLWTVFREISGKKARLFAIPYCPGDAGWLLRSDNVTTVWKIVEDTKELAVRRIAASNDFKIDPDAHMCLFDKDEVEYACS